MLQRKEDEIKRQDGVKQELERQWRELREGKENRSTNEGDGVMDEVRKLRQEFQSLCMSFSERDKAIDGPKMKDKGIKKMLQKKSDDEEESDGVSDEDERDRMRSKKVKEEKRKTSKTRFMPFRSSNKIVSKAKNYNQQKLSDEDEESEFEREKIQKGSLHKSISNNQVLNQQNSNDLTSSKSKYAKLAEKALHEMSQFTSEDEDAIIQKKRQHLINSLKKEYPRQSQRLENML